MSLPNIAIPMYLLLVLLWALSTDVLAVPDARVSLAASGYAAQASAGEIDPAHLRRELAASARLAAKTIAEHQQASGYWLTAYTLEARFERPRREMNTFTNAVLSDIAGPVAERAGIAGALQRMRAFLASQIEADGLVRYHGRPDAPTIGRLGCVITPDADDTALVWRITPAADRELLAKALATLDRFRAPNGLYMTWLAPQKRYRCIDPGRNPNPTDIAIQMHVLMLLAGVDPPAARALCTALSKEAGDGDIWVYYEIAPFIPLLRLADVHAAGCPLQLPESRVRPVAGQELWVEAARMLARIEQGRARPADHVRADDLLRRLSADGFSLVKASPPLLYHNDLTARLKRFYWSEDVGYALWLRLYFENERTRPHERRARSK
jgi:hypothetical protein